MANLVQAPGLNTTAVGPCYSGPETVFECGGSYAGYCNHSTGSCVCVNGWSGHSDFLSMDLVSRGGRVLDCPVHLQALQVLWAIVFGLTCASCPFVVLVALPKTWTTFKKRRKNPKKWWAHPPLQMQGLIFTCQVLAAVISGLKMLDQTRQETLIGIHEPISSLWTAYFWMITAVAHNDFSSRRTALVKKKLFLQGVSKTDISPRLRSAARKFRVLGLFTAICPLCYCTILVWYPQSIKDPTPTGRFFLFPGMLAVSCFTLLTYVAFVRQDSSNVDVVFTKLISMATATQTSGMGLGSLRRLSCQMPPDVQATLKTILGVREKVKNYYRTVALRMVVLAVVRALGVVVPPFWTRWSWMSPLVILLYWPSGLYTSAFYAPSVGRTKPLTQTMTLSKLPFGRSFRSLRSTNSGGAATLSNPGASMSSPGVSNSNRGQVSIPENKQLTETATAGSNRHAVGDLFKVVPVGPAHSEPESPGDGGDDGYSDDDVWLAEIC